MSRVVAFQPLVRSGRLDRVEVSACRRKKRVERVKRAVVVVDAARAVLALDIAHKRVTTERHASVGVDQVICEDAESPAVGNRTPRIVGCEIRPHETRRIMAHLVPVYNEGVVIRVVRRQHPVAPRPVAHGVISGRVRRYRRHCRAGAEIVKRYKVFHQPVINARDFLSRRPDVHDAGMDLERTVVLVVFGVILTAFPSVYGALQRMHLDSTDVVPRFKPPYRDDALVVQVNTHESAYPK